MKKDQFTVPVALSFMDKAGITEEQVIVEIGRAHV